MRNTDNYLILILLLIFLFSCKKDENTQTQFEKDKIIGVSQKGPFVNGSTMTVYELDAIFNQTGKSFNVQIKDNSGTFELTNISLLTNYVKLKADGFYFNEVRNTNSQAPITLYAYSDLANKNQVNINLLTNLEVSRMEYLLQNGATFNNAKKQAQQEILAMLSLKKPDLIESELLDISQNGDDNAILLAVSVILQGYRTEAELIQIMGDIATDIRTDGILNSSSTGTSLINDAKLLNLPNIRANIETKYQAMGVTATIPNFEKYVETFIDSSNYIFTKHVQYPYMINSKQNLLMDSSFVINTNNTFSVGAYLPTGTSLKVIVKSTPGYSANYGWGLLTNVGWTLNNFFPDSAVLTASGHNQTTDYGFSFVMPSSSLDFIIYENNAITPTRIKTIKYNFGL